jgi:hypothetical protein
MNIYSTLLKLFEHHATHILLKIFMNIREYFEHLGYFFNTLCSSESQGAHTRGMLASEWSLLVPPRLKTAEDKNRAAASHCPDLPLPIRPSLLGSGESQQRYETCRAGVCWKDFGRSTDQCIGCILSSKWLLAHAGWLERK